MEHRIKIEKAIEWILSYLYFKEYEVIDGLNQHKDGLSFSEWLEKNGLVED